MMWPRLASIPFWLLIAAEAGQLPAFRAETRLVVLHATVRNGRGALITDLSQTAFTSAVVPSFLRAPKNSSSS